MGISQEAEADIREALVGTSYPLCKGNNKIGRKLKRTEDIFLGPHSVSDCDNT